MQPIYHVKADLPISLFNPKNTHPNLNYLEIGAFEAHPRGLEGFQIE
jgi:hypothetical protein